MKLGAIERNYIKCGRPNERANCDMGICAFPAAHLRVSFAMSFAMLRAPSIENVSGLSDCLMFISRGFPFARLRQSQAHDGWREDEAFFQLANRVWAIMFGGEAK